MQKCKLAFLHGRISLVKTGMASAPTTLAPIEYFPFPKLISKGKCNRILNGDTKVRKNVGVSVSELNGDSLEI